MSGPQEISLPLRRSAELNATLSSCCGFTGEVTLTDSAIIILLAGALGASDTLSMLTTSLLPLFFGLLLLPNATLINRVGVRRLINGACGISAAAYFCAAASPFFGQGAKMVLLASIVLFSLSLSGFIAGWFPLADSFITADRRIVFFGRMRFCHQLTALAFLTVSGLLVGKESPIWKLQMLLFAAAVIYVGRLVFISRIPSVFSGLEANGVTSLRAALSRALRNKPLVGFSLYIFVLNFAAYGTVPLTLLYLKKSLNAPDNVVVFVSALALGGMLAGYYRVGRIVACIGVKQSLLLFHATFALANLAIFFVGGGGMAAYVLIGIIVMTYSFMIAAASVVVAGEMMALSKAGDKVVSMAFFGTFYYGGFGFSRLMTSLSLGSGIFASDWRVGSSSFSHYQTLFLLFALAILFAAVFLLFVPAVFPKGEFNYRPET